MRRAVPFAAHVTMPVRLPATTLRLGAVCGVALFAAGGVAVHAPIGTAQVAPRDAATEVRARIDAETRRINATADGIAAAQQRLAKLEAREASRRAAFLEAQDELVLARARLSRLEQRGRTARRALAGTLDAAFRRGTPDLASIVLEADGLEAAVEQIEFEVRVQRQNSNALASVREARRDATAQEEQLEDKEKKFRALARAAADDRDAAAAVNSALLRRQAQQLERRRGSRARLAALEARIRREERAQIAAASRTVAGATDAAPKITGSSQADAVVARVVAAANRIATTPYVWGGGHGGNNSGGYDCSGSISYALAAGGLLDAPRASGGFMSWGAAGPGRRITVYAHGGHAFMVVDGRRFDTTALRSTGTRWTSQMRSTAGFVARHPPGL